jgi:hypothetical protein
MQSFESKLNNSTIKNSQDLLKTIEVSALISCIVSICHVYLKFSLKIKDSTFYSLIWKNIGFWDVI